MTTKRARRKPGPAASHEIVIEDTTDDEPEDILAVLQQLGGEASICQLWRRDDKRKYAYLDECDPDAFDLKMIRDVWGGGEYQVRFLDANRGYLKARSFAVYGPAKGTAAVTTVAQPGQPASADPTSLMLEMMKMMREELRAASTRVDPTASNPLELAMKMSEMIQTSTLGAIQAMGLGNKSGNGLSLPDLLKAIPEFMELAREYAGGGESKGSTMDNMLLSLGTKVLEKMEGQPGISAANVRPALAGRTEPTGMAQSAATKPAWASVIQRSMPQLINWASAGKDARLYAEVLLDNVPEEAADFLGQQVARGQEFLDEFYIHFPDAASYKWWFDSLYREIGVLLSDDGGDNAREETESEHA